MSNVAIEDLQKQTADLDRRVRALEKNPSAPAPTVDQLAAAEKRAAAQKLIDEAAALEGTAKQ